METTTTQKSAALLTELQIGFVKKVFSETLAQNLNLIKVEAPLIVEQGTGINDDLNGIENPVEVKIKDLPEKKVEIVHSLAKWKRYKLSVLGAEIGQGLYTDMRALRPDEDLSLIHSVYVDQWDWEKVIAPEKRTLKQLKETVNHVYEALKETEKQIEAHFGITPILPSEITFVHSEDLLAQYPELSPKERENAITKQYGAVFLIGIGGKLANGEVHDGRAPDYDDWSSPTSDKTAGLNGDILVWNPILEKAFELSSMGIRVNPEALERQLELTNQTARKALKWHQLLLHQQLPQTIGGGIGQSRVAMFLLRKSHIGQVQASIWSEKERTNATLTSIELL